MQLKKGIQRMKIKRIGIMLLIVNLILMSLKITSFAKTKEHSITVYASDEVTESLSKVSGEYGTLCFDLYAVDEEKYRSEVARDNVDQEAIGYICEEVKSNIGDAGTVVNIPENAAYTGLLFNQTYEIEDGMYLLVVRGTKDDTTVIKENTVAVTGSENTTTYETSLVTYTLLDYFIFTAAPQLILNDESINLKMEVDPATGSIQINKSIFYKYYKDVENTVFVFQVDVLYPTENDLYSSEVYSINFTDSDFEGKNLEDVKKSIVISGLPINATVKISEVYKGLSYETQIGEEETNIATVTVKGDEIVNVDFTNVYTYENKNHGGGGITNRFEFKLETSSWEWTKEAGNNATINGASDKFLEMLLKLQKSEED